MAEDDFLEALHRAMTEAIENPGNPSATTGPHYYPAPATGRIGRLRFRFAWWRATRKARRGELEIRPPA